MKINYELTKEHFHSIKFNDLKYLPKTWKTLSIHRYGTAGFFIILGLLIYLMKWSKSPLILSILPGFGLLFLVMYPFFVEGEYRKRLEKELVKQPNMTGDFTVEIRKDGIYQLIKTTSKTEEVLLAKEISAYNYKEKPGMFILYLAVERIILLPIEDKDNIEVVREYLEELVV